MASRPAAWRSSSAWASPPTSATPRSRCSVETYSSPSRRASSSARSMTRLARGSSDQRAALDPGAPGEDRRELAAERGQVDAEPAERLGRDAVVGLDERGEDVLGVEDRAVEALGGGLGGDDGLLGLLGEAVELHGQVSRERGSGCVDRGLDERSRAAAPGLVGRGGSAGRPSRLDVAGRRGRSALKRGMPWPREPEASGRAGCRPGSSAGPGP